MTDEGVSSGARAERDPDLLKSMASLIEELLESAADHCKKADHSISLAVDTKSIEQATQEVQEAKAILTGPRPDSSQIAARMASLEIDRALVTLNKAYHVESLQIARRQIKHAKWAVKETEKYVKLLIQSLMLPLQQAQAQDVATTSLQTDVDTEDVATTSLETDNTEAE